MDYETDREIDVQSLDQEWLKQPQLYYKYSRLSADAENEVDRLKEKFEVTKAEIDTDIREAAKDTSEKITEKIVESRMLLNQKYQDSVSELNKAKHKHMILKGAVKAMDHKKSALENLVKLWSDGYFSTPREPKGSSIKEKAINNADEKHVKKLNNRRRGE